MKRTHTCGELSRDFIGKSVTLNGWVHRNRDHGGIHFINLRDRYGITQIVIDQDAEAPLKEKIRELRFEFCIAVQGIVRERPADMVNPEMKTGEIEVAAQNIEILNRSETLPFMIDEHSEAREELRLKYRYLDLRSFSMQRRIQLRNDVTFRVREYLIGQGFYEIETPTLMRSTPEGARDFLVPSRLHPGNFYALPQSPQLFKQIIMTSGFDKYFQIAHCFRDEDARGDRQPEHTQIDMEMSFVSKEDIFSVLEGMLSHVFRKVMDVEIKTPFPWLSYRDALNTYGTDKPDLRFELKIRDFSDLAEQSTFKVFQRVCESGGCVKALVVPGGADFSRKHIDAYEKIAQQNGAKGLAWVKITEHGLEGGMSKFFASMDNRIRNFLNAETGDAVFFVADMWKKACTVLGAVRSELGKDLNLIEKGTFKFAWVVDFPLFEWNEEVERWEAAHHMFTMPQEQYLDSLEQDPENVKGDLYDLVCNGLEVASGSIRIHNPELQQRIFNIVGVGQEEAEQKFGFLLEAFRYGAPPHGGIAPGLDRLVMIMCDADSIREVIAFPKNTIGISPMDNSPSPVDERQLEELHIKLVLPEHDDEKGESG